MYFSLRCYSLFFSYQKYWKMIRNIKFNYSCIYFQYYRIKFLIFIEFVIIWSIAVAVFFEYSSAKFKNFITFLFNRNLKRGCLVYMFYLNFSGSKFLINLQRHLWDLQSFHFVFQITISKMPNLRSRLLFH